MPMSDPGNSNISLNAFAIRVKLLPDPYPPMNSGYLLSIMKKSDCGVVSSSSTQMLRLPVWVFFFHRQSIIVKLSEMVSFPLSDESHPSPIDENMTIVESYFHLAHIKTPITAMTTKHPISV